MPGCQRRISASMYLWLLVFLSHLNVGVTGTHCWAGEALLGQSQTAPPDFPVSQGAGSLSWCAGHVEEGSLFSTVDRSRLPPGAWTGFQGPVGPLWALGIGRRVCLEWLPDATRRCRLSRCGQRHPHHVCRENLHFIVLRLCPMCATRLWQGQRAGEVLLLQLQLPTGR